MATGGFGATGTSLPSTAALLERKLRAEQIVKNGAGWFRSDDIFRSSEEVKWRQADSGRPEQACLPQRRCWSENCARNKSSRMARDGSDLTISSDQARKLNGDRRIRGDRNKLAFHSGAAGAKTARGTNRQEWRGMVPI